jgi:hypothetical protein
LILAHPLPLLPLLPGLPYDLLPGGVVLFIPITCVLAGLSACAHIVIVYLASYLKVHSFEEVFGAVAKSGYGLWAGRVAVMISVIGLVSSWLGSEFFVAKLTSSLSLTGADAAQLFAPHLLDCCHLNSSEYSLNSLT